MIAFLIFQDRIRNREPHEKSVNQMIAFLFQNARSHEQIDPRELRRSPCGFCLLVFVCVWLTVPLNLSGETLRMSGETMGTSWRVTVETDQSDSDSISMKIADRLAEINARMSTYIPDSEVSRFNQSSQTEWFDVSSETALVVQRALEIHQASDGAFDITVMPLVDRWGFGPTRHSDFTIPSQSEIDNILKFVGGDKISVRIDPPALKKSHAKTQIDLSAIAKGYAVDQISNLLIEGGYDRHLVEIGGEVRAGKRKSNGLKWRIGIERPVSGMREIARIIELENCSIASSGNYRNFFEIDGTTYGHSIDPRTGRPVVLKLVAVTILAEDCMTADALATACMVAGPRASLVSDWKSSALMFVRGENQSVEMTVGDFPPPVIPINSISVDDTSGNKTSSKNSDSEPVDSGVGFFPMFVAAVVVLLIAVLGMSLGVILGGKRIKGSCGALASSGTGVSSACDLCSKPVKDCPEKQAAAHGEVVADD